MKVNNDVIWQQAQVLAKCINDAYQNEKQCDGIVRNTIEDIKMSVKKSRFVCICKNVADYLPAKSDGFVNAVNMALSLPMEKDAEDKDIAFEMFIACVRFHLAFYKRDWKENK